MIYLNNAATSYPKPDTVIKAVMNYLDNIPFHSSRAGLEIGKEDIVYTCRQKLSSMFNIEKPENIIFTSGATESLNLAIFGLDLKGGHVITTAIEHNSVLRPLNSLLKNEIIELSIVDSDENGYINPENLRDCIKQNTKAIIVNHASNVTGEIQDIKSICEIAHANGCIFVVDASQSAGCIPIDVTNPDIDIMAFTGHKSLYGIQGIGGLYIKSGIRLKPLKVGGTGEKSESLCQPNELPMYYEAGTQNLPGIVSLSAGLDYILKIGLNDIVNEKNKIFEKAINKLLEMPRVILYGRRNANNRCPIFSFNIEGVGAQEVGYLLEKSFNIIVRTGLHCAPLIHKTIGSDQIGLVRVSLSHFTTNEEIDYFTDSVRQICEAKNPKIQ